MISAVIILATMLTRWEDNYEPHYGQDASPRMEPISIALRDNGGGVSYECGGLKTDTGPGDEPDPVTSTALSCQELPN